MRKGIAKAENNTKIWVSMGTQFNVKSFIEMLSEVIEDCKKSEKDWQIVCIGPLLWLQFLEHEKNSKKNSNLGSGWKKFEDVRSHIESIEVIPVKEAVSDFGVPIDLGIYNITKEGGWDFPDGWDSTSQFRTSRK